MQVVNARGRTRLLFLFLDSTADDYCREQSKGQDNTAALAAAARGPRKPEMELTSFGFLPQDDEREDSTFALGSLLSRVRSALGSSGDDGAASSSSSQGNSNLRHDDALLAAAARRSPDTDRQSRASSVGRISSKSTATANATATATTIPTSTATPAATSLASASASLAATPPAGAMPPPSSDATSERRQSHRSRPTFAIRSSTGAPAVTSTASAHALKSASFKPTRLHHVDALDDASIAGHARSDFDEDDEDDTNGGRDEDEDDVLTELMRKSGVDNARIARSKAAAAAAAAMAQHRGPGTNATASANDGRISVIPGFPLSKETLADDTRSIHSSSSRRPRSEVNSEAHLVFAHAQGHHHQAFNDASRGPAGASVGAGAAAGGGGGLSTSAEAFRRMRGEGAVLSRAFWMPDENVKECRQCQSYFTPFRRKHHCRICGQVYCSRCASNIIAGSRFGLAGSVRVCDYCLRMLSEYERAGMRSSSMQSEWSPSSPSMKTVATTYARKRVDSASSLFQQHLNHAAQTAFQQQQQMTTKAPDKGMISAPLEAQLQSPQAQFAANNLFSSGMPRRPTVPLGNAVDHNDESSSRPSTDEPAPFRAKLGEEDRVTTNLDEEASFGSSKPHSTAKGEEAPSQPKAKVQASQAVATTAAMGANSSTSSVLKPFPSLEEKDVSSSPPPSSAPSAATTPPAGHNYDASSDTRSRLVSDAALRAYRRSRLKSRPGPGLGLDPGSKGNLRVAATIASEALLEPSSHAHLSKLLEQSLRTACIPRAKLWHRTLLPLAVSVARNIHPNPKAGESMDIRQYIKIKRNPGGAIQDCRYVDGKLSPFLPPAQTVCLSISSPSILVTLGFVLSKQVATKRMMKALPLSSPRVMVVTFAIDFHQSRGQYLSLEPLLAQEHEFTRILVARILQLRPNILVVKESVSRLALDMFQEAGVIVVWSLKESAVQAISRCCQADIIPSIDRLALEPRLGRCASFDVETFENRRARGPGTRKTYMRFSTAGNATSLGCSIVLRGASLEVLAKIKAIVLLLTYVAHNLRLEERLNRDEGTRSCVDPSSNTTRIIDDDGDASFQDDDEEIKEALLPFKDAVLSSSAAVRITPPLPLVRVRESHRDVVRLARAHRAMPSSDDAVGDHGQGLKKPSERQPKFDRAVVRRDAARREWEEFRSQNFTSTTDSTRLQRIGVLCSLLLSSEQRPCLGPRLMACQLYGPGDETLGQYLERTCAESSVLCSARGCGRPRGVHYSSFIHNGTRVQVVLERFVCPVPGQEDRLLMWSYCKKCEKATPVTPASDETWSLSFAKYLELHFYRCNKKLSCSEATKEDPSTGSGTKASPLACSHDYYADCVRFFSLKNLAIRFHRDRDLTVRDVVLPPLKKPLPRPDVDCRLKLEEVRTLEERNASYWNSVIARLGALQREISSSGASTSSASAAAVAAASSTNAGATSESESTGHAPAEKTRTQIACEELDEAKNRADEDRKIIEAFLAETCRNSGPTDVLALNIVRSRLQATVVRWDVFLREFEKRNLVSPERDARRLTTQHLSRLFLEREKEKEQHLPLASSLTLTSSTDNGYDGGPPRSAAVSPASTSAVSSPTRLTRTTDSGSIPGTSSLAPALEVTDEGGSTDAKSESAPATWRRRKAERKAASVLAGTKKEDNDQKDSSSSEAKTSPDPDGSKKATASETRRPSMLPRARQSADAVPRTSRLVSSSLDKGSESDTTSWTGGASGQKATQRRLASGSHLHRSKKEGPPSSYRPIRGTLAAGQASSAESDVENAASALRRPGVVRRSSAGQQTTLANRHRRPELNSSTSGNSHTSMNSRLPVSTSQASNRVSTIARRFDNLHREAERERERQRQLMAVRARRARPVGASQAKVQVYRNVRDAVGDDDDEEEEEVHVGKGAKKKLQGLEEEGRDDDAKGEEADEEDAADDEMSTAMAKTDTLGPIVPVAGTDSKASQSSSQGQDVAHTTGDDGAERKRLEDQQTQLQKQEAKQQTAAEVTVSSLLSGTLPASWRSSDDGAGTTRGSLLKTITSLWGKGVGQLPLIEYPMLASEHLFSDSPLVVLREDEPSSLIAFTLHSSTYASRLQSLRDSHGLGESGQGLSMERQQELAMRQTESAHLSFAFSSGDSRFSIRVLFTEQFDALRDACGCQDSFVQSLARCWNWLDCTGGKSGATMMKTLDDRFIIKSLSKAEMDAWANNATAYFGFLSDVIFQNRPTTLAKILGVYKLTVRNPQTGKNIKLDCAVTENVFANAPMARIYDLKGALRNRFVTVPSSSSASATNASTSGPNASSTTATAAAVAAAPMSTSSHQTVLQDGNLLASKDPLFLHESAKRRLREALYHGASNGISSSLFSALLTAPFHTCRLNVSGFVRCHGLQSRRGCI